MDLRQPHRQRQRRRVAWPVYKNFGELELRDLEDGVTWLKSQPYVDGSRIGMWGWSYGGFMTSYALTHSKSSRWELPAARSLTGATTTRFTPSVTWERRRTIRKAIARVRRVHAAKNLHGKLLLIHGAIDDNVHMQNTIQFVYELQKAGKQFELMIYPKSRHGVTDPLLLKHMRQMMTDFILANL